MKLRREYENYTSNKKVEKILHQSGYVKKIILNPILEVKIILHAQVFPNGFSQLMFQEIDPLRGSIDLLWC